MELPIRISNHYHFSSFLVCELGDYPMVLGLRWLSKHNPTINWESRDITFESNYCKGHCLPEELKSAMEEPYEPPANELRNQIPPQYHDSPAVFREEQFKSLPPHQPYDIAIDFKEGAKLLTGPIYNMTPSESRSLK